MYQIVIGLQTVQSGRDQITPRGLHGLLFNVLQQYDPEEATWLHQHRSPKPFSTAVYYTAEGTLAGVRYGALTERVGVLLAGAWQQAQAQQEVLNLGKDNLFIIHTVEVIPCLTFPELADQQPVVHDMREQTLRFVAPTDFKQGPVSLPLPLPPNVFRGPFRVWQTFAPATLQLPDSWLDWCADNVYITAHDIQTITVPLTGRHEFTGFVGTVTYRAYRGSKRQLFIWQTLGTLATFCGIGRKTPMGMGAVEKVGASVYAPSPLEMI